MRTKTILLGSVSAIATAAAATGGAQAQVLAAGDDGYTFNIGGGLLLSPAETFLADVNADKAGSGFDPDFNDFDDQFGYNAFFSVGKQIDNNWDIRFGGAINQLIEVSGSVATQVESGGGSGSGSAGQGIYGYSYTTNTYIAASHSFSFETMDFEVGYTPVLTDTMSVRLFAGIRGLHMSGSSSTTIAGQSTYEGSSYGAAGSSRYDEENSFSVSNRTNTEFFGAGPRIGVAAAHRFEGSQWGISGQVAGSLLFGRQVNTSQTDVNFSYSYSYSYSGIGGTGGGQGDGGSGSSFTSSYSVDKMVVDLEAKAGVDFYLDDSAALTFGYKVEQLMNTGTDDDMSNTKLTHGPFLSLSGAL